MQKKIQIVAKLFSCCKTFLSCRKTLVSFAKHFLVSQNTCWFRKTLVSCRKTLLSCRKTLLSCRKTLLSCRKTLLSFADRETLLKESTIQTESETISDVMMIYLPNSYHSKPKLPSLCQMDPASICCLQCLSLRLLLFLGMNVLVTPELNPRELVCR